MYATRRIVLLVRFLTSPFTLLRSDFLQAHRTSNCLCPIFSAISCILHVVLDAVTLLHYLRTINARLASFLYTLDYLIRDLLTVTSFTDPYHFCFPLNTTFFHLSVYFVTQI